MTTSTQFSATATLAALNLHERGQLDSEPAPTTGPERLADRRAQRWRELPPFADHPELFTARLEQSNLTERIFARLVDQEPPANTPVPNEYGAWVTQLEHSLSRAPRSSAQLAKNSILADLVAEQGEFALLVAFERLIAPETVRLEQAFSDLQADDPFCEDLERIVESWIACLAETIVGMVDRTLVLELHVARINGTITGDTPDARFHAYLERLRQPEVVQALLEEYPVLARQVVHTVSAGVDFGIELITRFQSDRAELRRLITGGDEPLQIAHIVPQLGDPHDGGQSVCRLQLTNGERVIYKPRPVAMDAAFARLLKWLAGHDELLPLRSYKVLDREGYGWLEFITASACNNRHEVQRFHRRQGMLVALTYLLSATDFHYENLIAAGEHPVLIDLETLLQPHIADLHPLAAQTDELAYCFSVLRSGLLPHRIGATSDKEGIDIGGIAGLGAQALPNGRPTWTARGSDEMRLTREDAILPDGDNRARLPGHNIVPLDYLDDLLVGFEEMYSFFLRHRHELLAEHGVLAPLMRAEQRVIVRSTQKYAVLRYDALHPNRLRDGLDREQLLDKLWQEVPERPNLAQLIPSERHDLERGDVPAFVGRPNSVRVRDSQGKSIAGVIRYSGQQLCQTLLHRLSPRDLGRQKQLITMAFESLRPLQSTREPLAAERTPTIDLPHRDGRDDPDYCRALAEAIGTTLMDLCIRDTAEQVYFMELAPRGQVWAMVPVSANLYSGLAGIAVFSAHLGALTGNEKALQLARLSLASATQRRGELQALGGFDGLGGLLYSQSRVARLLGDRSMRNDAHETVRLISNKIADDRAFDVIAGSAGAILALASYLHEADIPDSERIFAQATIARAAGHLLAHAQDHEYGLVWQAAGEASAPLTGYAHGTSGIAHALQVAARICQRPQFASAAGRAFDYERALFDDAVQNWPDFRVQEGETPSAPSHESAWCHGAPGIALARWACHFDQHTDRTFERDIKAAVASVHRQAGHDDHSLCHGDLGRIEVLLQASLRTADDQITAQFAAERRRIIDSLTTHGIRGGLPFRSVMPGLMVGLAGIGYQLLRLSAPDAVPSILTLESLP